VHMGSVKKAEICSRSLLLYVVYFLMVSDEVGHFIKKGAETARKEGSSRKNNFFVEYITYHT
jgi:hypothetical protein